VGGFSVLRKDAMMANHQRTFPTKPDPLKEKKVLSLKYFGGWILFLDVFRGVWGIFVVEICLVDSFEG
jgi:hypothetical protein